MRIEHFFAPELGCKAKEQGSTVVKECFFVKDDGIFPRLTSWAHFCIIPAL